RVRLTFELVDGATPRMRFAEPAARNVQRNIEQKRDIGSTVSLDPVLEFADTRNRHGVAGSLVRVGRVGVAVAQNPFAARKSRSDHAVQMLASSREHQQRLAVGRHRLTQYKLTQPLAERRAARLARGNDAVSPGSKALRKP